MEEKHGFHRKEKEGDAAAWQHIAGVLLSLFSSKLCCLQHAPFMPRSLQKGGSSVREHVFHIPHFFRKVPHVWDGGRVVQMPCSGPVPPRCPQRWCLPAWELVGAGKLAGGTPRSAGGLSAREGALGVSLLSSTEIPSDG